MQDKNVKILGFLEKIQADNKEIVEKHIEKRKTNGAGCLCSTY